jgi:glycosyltransferase involved in cell wall biosynthesis
MSRILFNATTNIIGGGIKNSALFVKMALADNSLEWHFAISPQVAQLLKDSGIDLDASFFTVFEYSPARNRESRKQLLNLEAQLTPDIIYTMAGPAYVKFKGNHVMGISNGYITHAGWEAFRVFGNCKRTLKFMAKVAFQSIQISKANNLIFQTEAARSHYCKRMAYPKARTTVISNAFDESMIDQVEGLLSEVNKIEGVNIICPGADYLHKGFQFIPQIAKQMTIIREKNEKFKFILTLPDGDLWKSISEEAKKLGIEECIVNRGPYSYKDVAKVYASSEIVFIPSLLETFCASYLEAILLNKKLVVANRAYSREVCGSYATYVEPRDFTATAKELLQVMNVKNTQEHQEIKKGILMKYGNQKDRFNRIKAYLKVTIGTS